MSFSTLGLSVLLMRDISRDSSVAQRYLSNILSWRVILSGIVYLLLVITILFLMKKSAQIEKIVIIMGLAVMMKYHSMTGITVLRGFQRFDLEALTVVLEQFSLLICGAVFLLIGKNLYSFAVSFLCVRTCGCIFTYYLIHRLTPYSFKFEWSLIWQLQLKAIPLGLLVIVSTAYVQVNTLILSSMLDYHSVGLYNAAFKIYFGLFLVPGIFQAIFFPRLSRTFYADKKEHNTLLAKGIISLLIISLPISICGIVFSEKIILFAFGIQFLASSYTMKFFFGILMISFQLLFLRTIFVSIDKQMVILSFNIAGLITLVLLDYVLIPEFGITGAALALGGSELLVLLGLWTYLLKKHFRLGNIREAFDKISSAIKLNLN